MKTVLYLALGAMVAGVARADWSDLRPGMDAKTAWRCAGAPMLQTNGRATQQWNYDRGGYILFERGRVIYWEASKPVKPVVSIAKREAPPAKATRPRATIVAAVP